MWSYHASLLLSPSNTHTHRGRHSLKSQVADTYILLVELDMQTMANVAVQASTTKQLDCTVLVACSQVDQEGTEASWERGIWYILCINEHFFTNSRGAQTGAVALTTGSLIQRALMDDTVMPDWFSQQNTRCFQQTTVSNKERNWLAAMLDNSNYMYVCMYVRIASICIDIQK